MSGGAAIREASAGEPAVFRVGAVRFLNARPLIHGLGGNPRVRLHLDVPSALGPMLDAGRLDAALVPTIDCLRARPRWRILPAGCIASDGATLTVRIFSSVPIERIAALAADPDSHTSVALAELILRGRYGLSVRTEPLDLARFFAAPPDQRPQSVLLIGDKVVSAATGNSECGTRNSVCRTPDSESDAWPYQLDLGSAWVEWTGLPFVFAVWAARADTELGDLPSLLEHARQSGQARLEQIARADGPALGWPAELACEYLTRRMQYELTPRRRAGMERFFELARAAGLADPVRPADRHGR